MVDRQLFTPSSSREDSPFKGPVFLVGMPRSGTTLLQGILCKAGGFDALPETHFFSRATLGLKEKDFRRLRDEQYLRISLDLQSKAGILVAPDELQRYHTKRAMFERVLRSAMTPGATRFLEKTPRHVFCFDEIMSCYADARFVCMVRSPKNMVSSIFEMSPARRSVLRVALLYNKLAAAILRIRGKKNVTVVSYEDMTARPAETIKAVCDFVAVPFSPGLLDDVRPPTGTVRDEEKWKRQNVESRAIRPDDPERWRRTLTPSQGSLVDLITARQTRRLGYFVSLGPAAAGRAAAAAVQDLPALFTRDELRAAFSRIQG